MEQKLQELYIECVEELESIGISIKEVGTIAISISTRASKRYGCCKQENPDISTKVIYRLGFKRIIKYEKFNKHNIEISIWVMNLNDEIIKNTIMHEIIHCFPYCNNHGEYFKKYANIINKNLGYNITRLGNKEKDYVKSNLAYNEVEKYNYKIECKKCGQTFFRKRLNKNLIRRYRCGKCGGKFEVTKMNINKIG